MVSYHLSIIDVIKAWFFPLNTLSILVSIILILATFNAGKNAYRDMGMPMFPKSIIMLLVILAIPVLLIGSELGSGWQVKGDELLIKAPPSSVSIKLKSTTMALMSGYGSSQWTPESGTMGVRIAGLATGSFTLKNGKSAVVFSYFPGNKIVVLKYQDKYYEISYPGVPNLYKELKSQSVKDGLF